LAQISRDKEEETPMQEEENNLIENDIQSFSLEYMELEEDIEKIFPAIEQEEHVSQQHSLLEVVGNETFSDEESFTFQSVFFYGESKKMIVEIIDQKNKKGKSGSEEHDLPILPKGTMKEFSEDRTIDAKRHLDLFLDVCDFHCV
jgi:hypothetical protein